MLATTALKLIATSSSCTGALPGSWRDRHGGIGQEGLARRWAGPGSTECGLWAWVRPVPSLSLSPNPTVALYLFGSCFGDWVGLDCGPKDVCRASPTLHPLHTCPVPSVCSPPTPSLGPEQPLTPGQKSLCCLPTTPYTLTETAIPHPPY